MKISVSDVGWLDAELWEQFQAGNKWSVCECYGPDQTFQHVHLYKDRDKALDFCANYKGNTVSLQETIVLQNLMENIYDSDKDRDDIDYYVIDDLSLAVSRVLKINSDQNPLYNPDGNEFTDELISHFENQNSGNKLEQATILYPFIETELMDFPIVALNNLGSKNSLVRALAEEHLQVITFEKTFIPASLIEEYAIIDQKPLDNINPQNSLKVVDSIKTLEEAQKKFYKLAEEAKMAGDTTYLMLVGKYHNRKLEVNAEGDVQHNTGLMIDIDYTGIPSITKGGSKYPVDPNFTTTVREHMYSRFDVASTAMVFYDFSTLKMKIPDKEFWNRENITLKKDLKERNMTEGNEESLLTKTRDNNGKGMRR